MANPLPLLLGDDPHKLNLKPRVDCALPVADGIAQTLARKTSACSDAIKYALS